MDKAIEPGLKFIGQYLKIDSKNTFVIPEYQRGYSWTITQCDKLWQDIEQFIESEAAEPYFFGTIIIDCSEPNKLCLIDGQQRTTTFLLLLKALQLRLQDVLNCKGDSDSDSFAAILKKKYDKTIEILYKADDETCYEISQNWNVTKGIELVKNNSINELYNQELQIILESKSYEEAEGKVFKIPRKKKDNRYTNFFKNFKFFYDNLKNKTDIPLNKFAKDFLDKCQVIEIRSWQTEQAITMFNSLNSTGMPLSDADIISAQLYSHAGENKAEFNEIWERINKTANDLNAVDVVNIDSVLQQFMYINRAKNREYIKNDSVDVTMPGLRKYYILDNKKLLDSPFELCENFEKILKIWDYVRSFPVVKLLLKFNENAKIFLISYLYRKKADEWNCDNVEEIVESLIRLFTLLELEDYGYSSKNFKTFLFRENLKLVDPLVSESEIVMDFKNHIEKNWNRKEVAQYLQDYGKNILVFLNEYLYAKEKNPPLKFDFSDNVNIEHIMPGSGKKIEAIRIDAGMDNREEFIFYLNKLGNKILLEENINKSIGNDWFRVKKQTTVKEKAGYNGSEYNIARALVHYSKDVWKQLDIEIATEKASNRILDFLFSEK